MRKISLLYTSARPTLIMDLLIRWRSRCENWEAIEVIVVTDEIYTQRFENMTWHHNTGRHDCVTGWNLAASKATGDMMVQVSDDLSPPKNWDRKLWEFAGDASHFTLQLPDERGLPNVVYHPVVSRRVYEHFGYLYPPDFRSMFCDNWLFAAHAQKGFLRRVHLNEFWLHRHRTTHNVAVDDVMRRHESEERYEHGLKVLANELRALGMALEVDSPPGSGMRIVKAPA